MIKFDGSNLKAGEFDLMTPGTKFDDTRMTEVTEQGSPVKLDESFEPC